MREILFRGKRIDNGEWVEGYLIHDKHDGLYRIVIKLEYSTGTYIVTGFAPRVNVETIGQYTGLTDKNGKRIFEGDIVRDVEAYMVHLRYVELGVETEKQAEEYRYSGKIGVVKFHTEDIGSCGCCYPDFEGSGFKANNIKLSCCEVIGNIHDNPELLKGESNDTNT